MDLTIFFLFQCLGKFADNNNSLRDKSYFSYDKIDKLSLGGVSIKYLREKHNLTGKDLEIFLPINSTELSQNEINVHYLGYYLKWIPQEVLLKLGYVEGLHRRFALTLPLKTQYLIPIHP